MPNQTFSEILNMGYLGTKHGFDVDKLDRVMRSIIALSAEASDYVRDEITTVYPDVGPLHFDFLRAPLMFRFNTGIFLWETIEKPVILQSQGILVDFGVYNPYRKNTDGHPSHTLYLVAATKRYQKPTVYMVHGVEEQIEMDVLRSKMRLEELDILMVNDPNDPDSLKEILKKLVEITY